MTDHATAPTESSLTPSTLSTVLFEEALDKHLDASKPDPLALRQVQAWHLQWDNDGGSDHNTQNGTLQIHGEHMMLMLDSHCVWSTEKVDGGTLAFTLTARARFRTKSETQKADDKTQNKKAKKMSAGVIQRLCDDPYVKPLLERGAVLCEAHIRIQGDELEERVRVEEDALEGTRRCIYSHAEDTLSVLELLVSLPYLPSNSLAQRAKLRLLEDAMVDACERAGEDELLDDLSLNEKESDQDANQLSKRSKQV